MKIPWTEEEVEILKKLWNDSTILLEDIHRVLKSRTPGAIRAKAAELGFGPVNQRVKPQIDIEYLKKLQEVVLG